MTRYENLPELPQWLKDVLPAPREPITVHYENDLFILQHETLDDQAFKLLEDAYDAAEKLENNDPESIGGVIFRGDVPEGYSNWGRGTFFTVKETRRVLLFSEDKQSYDVLRMSYRNWLDCAELYDKNPASFQNSYFFVDMHPMFWTRSTNDEDFNAKRPFSWETRGHVLSRILHEVYFEDDKHQHVLETGSHVPPHYTTHYYDHMLDVYADTYEEAIIELAEKIATRYHHDGSEKQDLKQRNHNEKH